MQSRAKHVVIPIRGFGKCPKESSYERYSDRSCNTQECVGDEICIAHQDLVIAIDGSASVTDGFQALKDYALALVSRYQANYFGGAAMKVGVVEFGNGQLMADGQTVSPAINLQALTTEMGSVTTAITDMVHQAGFTNMAQALALAETMYSAGGREGAQQALLVITDGKPSFQFQTNELVQQLDDKGVQRFFVVVTDDVKSVDLMKTWASQPWETNLLHVQGIAPLQADNALWAQKALTLFCPAAMSPDLLEVKEQSGGFMHVKDGGYCGGRGNLLSRTVADAEGCAYLAQGDGAHSFILGTWFRRGYCYAGQMTADEVSSAYSGWQADRVAPTCTVGTGWTSSMIFDFYAMQPVAASD
jgi:hypothetical protein